MQSSDNLEIEGLTKPEWAPILVIVPPSVIDNWKNEFEAWGHFEVCTYQGSRREKALQKVKEGISEVLVVGKSLAMTYASKLMEVPWKLIVVDEVHAYKVCLSLETTPLYCCTIYRSSHFYSFITRRIIIPSRTRD